jgi:hypothetical protein
MIALFVLKVDDHPTGSIKELIMTSKRVGAMYIDIPLRRFLLSCDLRKNR